MDYKKIEKELKDLIEKIKIAEEKVDKEPEFDIESENMDYTEQFLETEKITQKNANSPEKLKNKFDKIVKETLKNLEIEKSKIEKEIEEKLENAEDYNSIYFIGELQTKYNNINKQIDNIKELSNKENEREELGAIKKEIINEEKEKLEKRKQEIEQKIQEKSNDNDYMEQYMLGDLQAELHELNKCLDILKSGNFTKQQINDAIIEINELQEEKNELENKVNSVEANEANEVYLSGEQHNKLNKVNDKLRKLSVFNADIEKNKKENVKKENVKKERRTVEISELKIVYNRESNSYILTDERNKYTQNFKLDSKLLKKKNINELVNKLENTRKNEFEFDISSMIDANLYNCLLEYDKALGTNRADEYISSLDGKTEAKLDVTYDLKGKRTLGIIDNFKQNRIAQKNEKYIGAKVEKNENAIIKTIKDLFEKVKTKSLPLPKKQLETSKDIQQAESKRENFSESVKVKDIDKFVSDFDKNLLLKINSQDQLKENRTEQNENEQDMGR